MTTPPPALPSPLSPAAPPPINGVSGANVVYTIGDPSGNNYIGKLFNDGAHGAPLTASNLVFAGGARLPLTGANAISGPEGLLAKVDPDNAAWVDLFVQNADGVYFAVDKSGTTSGSIASLSFAKIIGTANVPLPAGGNFYGISSGSCGTRTEHAGPDRHGLGRCDRGSPPSSVLGRIRIEFVYGHTARTISSRSRRAAGPSGRTLPLFMKDVP